MSFVKNLMLKTFVIYYKYMISKVSCLVSVSARSSLVSSRLFAQSLGLRRLMSHLVSVSKFLAETPALMLILLTAL